MGQIEEINVWGGGGKWGVEKAKKQIQLDWGKGGKSSLFYFSFY